jgi:hypothetical protein
MSLTVWSSLISLLNNIILCGIVFIALVTIQTYFVFFLMVVGFELRASHLQNRHSTV